MARNGNRARRGAADSVSIGSAAEPTHTPAPTQYEIVVTPLRRGRFEARLGARVILESSRQPLLDGARALLEAGADPKARITMRHAGANHVAISSTIGAAARLDVADNHLGKPIFHRHRDRGESGGAALPSGFGDAEAISGAGGVSAAEPAEAAP